MHKRAILFILLLAFNNTQCLKIDRAIVSSDANPMYLQFWPLVARAWQQLIGVRPTLLLIADDTVEVDESVGDVIRFQPIPGVPTATHAQCIRLLAPAYFEDDVCIISDIDMLPLSKAYFVNSIKDLPDDAFVVYRDRAYGNDARRFPMCYNVGKGCLYKSIFRFNSVADIPYIIKKWVEKGFGWNTDEIILTAYVRQWPQFKENCVLLGHTSMETRRIDRSNWQYNKEKLNSKYYIDAHMVRPLDKYYAQIKELVDDLGIAL